MVPAALLDRFRADLDALAEPGIRIGIATNIADEYEFYIKQYGGAENPQFRLLTQPTTVALNDYPQGVDIETTDETASGFTEVATVYFVKVFNVGWSEVFDPAYTDGIMIASTDYGYSEDDATGIVRSGEFDTCYTYNAPFENFVAPFAQCVIPGRDGTLTAVFGYYNRTRYDAIIPGGPYNKVTRPFNTTPLPFTPPSNFDRGIHYNAFRVTGKALALTWTIEAASARATLLSPRCRLLRVCLSVRRGAFGAPAAGHALLARLGGVRGGRDGGGDEVRGDGRHPGARAGTAADAIAIQTAGTRIVAECSEPRIIAEHGREMNGDRDSSTRHGPHSLAAAPARIRGRAPFATIRVPRSSRAYGSATGFDNAETPLSSKLSIATQYDCPTVSARSSRRGGASAQTW